MRRSASVGRRAARSGARERHLADLQGGRGDAGAEPEVVADHLDVAEHLEEIAGDGHLPTLRTATPAGAGEYFVDTTLDDADLTDCDSELADDCRLRGALIAANALPDSEETTIHVPNGSYVLTDGENCFYTTTQSGGHLVQNTTSLCVAGRITVVGESAANTVIDGNDSDRVFLVANDAPVSIEQVTIRGGRHTSSGLFGGGGAINNERPHPDRLCRRRQCREHHDHERWRYLHLYPEADASGSGWTAAQATAARRPQYRSAGLNGRPAVTFDGIDDRLVIAGSIIAGAQPRTVFLALRADIIGNKGALDLGKREHSGRREGDHAGNGRPRLRRQPGVAIGRPRRRTRRSHRSLPAAPLQISPPGSTATAPRGGTAAAAINTGGDATIGGYTAAPTGFHSFAAAIAEIAVYDRALSTSGRQVVEAYLRSRYGIP